MNPWKPFPLIRLLIPFLGGVVYALKEAGWQPEERWLIGVIGFLTTGLLLFTLLGKLPFSLRWIPGTTTCLLMLCLGVLTVQSNSPKLVGSEQWVVGSEQLAVGSSDFRIFPAEIAEPPRHTPKTVKLIVSRYNLDTNANALIREGKALLFLEKDTNSQALQYGDWILVSTLLKPVKNESNPYGFDPAGYYGRKGVFSQGWVGSADWKLAGIPEHSSIRGLAFASRDRLLKILRENSIKGEEFAVASAILLGYTGEIGQDLRRGFAASGAMHILAVSGMHVGIIFLFLETIFTFLNRRRHGPTVKAVLMILMIWCYAMVTGLSPPVFRAGLMLSLVILGRTFKRKPDSLNVVGGSMFVILLLDPTLILHLGFQFSYLAVFGILFLYRPIVDLIPATGWAPSRLWGLVAVSIAAQIATFPIALYAFHQFPNYFILTNIIVLPLASLLIYSGIGVLALSPVPFLSAFLAKGLSFIAGLINSTIRFIEALPGSTFTGLYPSLPDVLMLYFGIVSICCFLFFRRAVWAYMFFILIIFWSLTGIYKDYMRTNRSMVVVFQIKGASQYVFVEGRSAVCVKDYQAACQEQYALEVLSTFMSAEGITTAQTTYLTDRHAHVADDFREFGSLARKGNLLQFSNKRIAIISSELPFALSDTLEVDLVIVRKNPDIHMETVVRLLRPEQIVIDPTNSWYNARKWKEQSEVLGILCYSVAEDGAYVLDVRRLGCRIPDKKNAPFKGHFLRSGRDSNSRPPP